MEEEVVVELVVVDIAVSEDMEDVPVVQVDMEDVLVVGLVADIAEAQAEARVVADTEDLQNEDHLEDTRVDPAVAHLEDIVVAQVVVADTRVAHLRERVVTKVVAQEVVHLLVGVDIVGLQAVDREGAIRTIGQLALPKDDTVTIAIEMVDHRVLRHKKRGESLFFYAAPVSI